MLFPFTCPLADASVSARRTLISINVDVRRRPLATQGIAATDEGILDTHCIA
jgi:hypothetical protein